jgi:hypothetical protein
MDNVVLVLFLCILCVVYIVAFNDDNNHPRRKP